MIYFNRELQNKVIRLFYESLPIGGILCLGLKESINFSDYSENFIEVIKNSKIYKKVK
jgi:chemotaxis protein methyltransferase CheR